MSKRYVERYIVGGKIGSAQHPIKVNVKQVMSQGRTVYRSEDFEYSPSVVRTWDELTDAQKLSVEMQEKKLEEQEN